MTITDPAAKTDARDAQATPAFDFSQLRQHARQLQQDLENIRAELASMKARYAPTEESPGPIAD